MQFMMIVKGDKDYEAGMLPNPELMAAIARLGEEATKAGTLLSTGGLLPTSTGALVRVGRGKLTVTDGPFPETKEVVGGYAIFELPSKEAAIEQGKRFMKLHVDILGPSYEGELQIRQMFDPADASH